MLRYLKKVFPWWLKIGSKIVLSRLPISYTFWKGIGLFVHGDMNQPKRSLENYLMYAEMAGLPRAQDLENKDFSVLELGPGDSAFTALVARALGAESVWLIDAGAFASTDTAGYTAMVTYLESQGYSFPLPLPITNVNDLLGACNAKYLIDGVLSFSHLPDQSIDFCLSNAVLEHIPKRDFSLLVNELRRVLKPNGVCVHRVDLKDHLGGGLNNLRFSDQVWEGSLFRESGFYTNRIRFSQMLAMFNEVGFDCTVSRRVMWDVLPISRKVLNDSFQAYLDDDLLVREFDVVLRLKDDA